MAHWRGRARAGKQAQQFYGNWRSWCCSKTRHAQSGRRDLQAELLFRHPEMDRAGKRREALEAGCEAV